MCCFSRPVESVSSTRIFARRVDQQTAVIYSMRISAAEDLAMVLPLPVFRPEPFLRFVDLSGYKDFFKDMERGFPRPVARSFSKGLLASYSADRSTLEVQQVGAFEASFVPRASDFGRLDERFRLPPDAVAAIPGVQNMSFAVFRLAAGEADIHPMAFTYRSSGPVVFPTLHIHDGEVHDRAEFDHTLYFQPERPEAGAAPGWAKSAWLAKQFMRVGSDGDRTERGDSAGIYDKTCGLVDPHQSVYRLGISGLHRNEDMAVS